MLLEEDGRNTTRRVSGGSSTRHCPNRESKNLALFELALSADRTPLKVNQGDVEIQRTTQFTSTYLNLDDEANTCQNQFVEHDDRPVAISGKVNRTALGICSYAKGLWRIAFREAASIPGSAHRNFDAFVGRSSPPRSASSLLSPELHGRSSLA